MPFSQKDLQLCGGLYSQDGSGRKVAYKMAHGPLSGPHVGTQTDRRHRVARRGVIGLPRAREVVCEVSCG